jgi:hypothetical protein
MVRKDNLFNSIKEKEDIMPFTINLNIGSSPQMESDN